jgi:hypothetical protein
MKLCCATRRRMRRLTAWAALQLSLLPSCRGAARLGPRRRLRLWMRNEPSHREPIEGRRGTYSLEYPAGKVLLHPLRTYLHEFVRLLRGRSKSNLY